MPDQDPPEITDATETESENYVVRNGLKYQKAHPHLLLGGHQLKGKGKKTVRVSDISRIARQSVVDADGIGKLKAIAAGTGLVRDKNPDAEYIKKNWTISRPPTWAEQRQAIMDLTDLGTKGKLVLVIEDTTLAQAMFMIAHKYVAPDLLDLFQRELKETMVNLLAGDGESPAEEASVTVAHGIDGSESDPASE